MKTIHDFIPELPLAQLVRTPPLKRVFQTLYSPETLIDWAKTAGLEAKNGRTSTTIKEKCLDTMPKSWNFEWFKEK